MASVESAQAKSHIIVSVLDHHLSNATSDCFFCLPNEWKSIYHNHYKPTLIKEMKNCIRNKFSLVILALLLLYNSKFAYRPLFIKTRHLHLRYLFPIILDNDRRRWVIYSWKYLEVFLRRPFLSRKVVSQSFFVNNDLTKYIKASNNVFASRILQNFNIVFRVKRSWKYLGRVSRTSFYARKCS